MITYQQLRLSNNFLLLDCISGSVAYNLNTSKSDIDKKGVFIMPQNQLYGFIHQEQISNDSNDEVYYEVARFLDLLVKNNPNILELLNTPKEHILYRHPIMDLIKPEDFLSKLCLDTFAGYAQTQIKKARELNKKINQPIPFIRKSVLDFCYVIHNNTSLPLKEWLDLNKFLPQECALSKLDHFRNVYLLYHQSQTQAQFFQGIISGPDADDVQLSQIPYGFSCIATMHFNKDNYSTYCREYKEYKDWESKRNDVRYQSTLLHGKNYDAKNMMHTFRLLNMAEEIAKYGQIIVKREDRDYLLRIRNGEFEFDYLMGLVEDKVSKLNEMYESCPLPSHPEIQLAEELLIEIRHRFYN